MMCEKKTTGNPGMKDTDTGESTEDEEWQAVRQLGKGASSDKVDREQLDRRAGWYERYIERTYYGL